MNAEYTSGKRLTETDNISDKSVDTARMVIESNRIFIPFTDGTFLYGEPIPWNAFAEIDFECRLYIDEAKEFGLISTD